MFPEYYYQDARRTHIEARAFASAGRVSPGSPSIRFHTFATGLVYRLVGERPALIGAFAGLAVAASIGLLGAALAPEFGVRAAAATTIAAAIWPSAIFHTSQNLKDPWIIALFYAALAALIGVFRGPFEPLKIVGAMIALITIGFLRSYVLAGAASAFVLAAAIQGAIDRKLPRRLVFAALIAIAAILAYKAASRMIYEGPLRAGNEAETTAIVPTATSASGESVTLLSPQGLSEFRRIRQENDRQIARDHQRREVGTQILPGARFDSWLDVAVALPQAACQILFMPLPGFYALEGKLGRFLAALENTLLLVISAAAIFWLLRNRTGDIGLFLLSFFVVVVFGTALLEFDLGGASRHKLLYFPLIFPFAFSWLEGR